jgi:serine/threonine protein kinase
MSCPDENTLACFMQGLLPEVERASVEQHLDTCRNCASVLVAIGRAVSQGETAPYRALARGDDDVGPGRMISRYQILEPIDRGGMGAVFAARDPALDRVVALKILHERSERLLREARALARLPHPNVVAVYDVGEELGRPFIAMELVRGTSLTLWLQEKPRAWEEVLRAFVQAGRGLAAAHRAGILHRDFKPDNVLVGRDGRVRVTDFGLARHVTAEPSPDSRGSPRPGQPDHGTLGSPSLTRAGTILGTPAYMPPEQLRAEVIDARADQFSFCVALHEALYGARPYAAGSLPELRRLHDSRLPLRRPPPGAVPSWVFPVIAKGLSVDRHRRHRTMDDLLEELRDAVVPQADLHVKINAGMQLLLWPVHTFITVFMVWALLSPSESGGGHASSAVTESAVLEGSTKLISLVLAVWLACLVFFGWAPLGIVWTPINAYGLLRKRRWGYISSVVYAVFSLPSCVGTPFAAYALATLWSRARKKSRDFAPPLSS